MAIDRAANDHWGEPAGDGFDDSVSDAELGRTQTEHQVEGLFEMADCQTDGFVGKDTSPATAPQLASFVDGEGLTRGE
jgi:hypothetical protein